MDGRERKRVPWRGAHRERGESRQTSSLGLSRRRSPLRGTDNAAYEFRRVFIQELPYRWYRAAVRLSEIVK